jgi:hypothetical protein
MPVGLTPKWKKWRLVPKVRIWEAVCLSLNIEPGKIVAASEEYLITNGQRELKPQEFSDRMLVALRNLTAAITAVNPPFAEARSLKDYWISLAEFAMWAASSPWQIPPELEAIAKKSEAAKLPETEPRAETTEQPMTESERTRLLKQVAVLSLILAEKVKRYRRGQKPNANQIADSVAEMLDALPGANKYGLSSTNIRGSIAEGVALLML